MRETVGDGKVLKHPRDPGLDGLKDILRDWNLHDITSTADFWINRLEFRLEADLQRQLYEGANGDPGDRGFIQPAARSQRRDPQHRHAVFLDTSVGPYGSFVQPTGEGRRRSMEAMAAQSGLLVPAHEAECLTLRRSITLKYYNDLIEETLDLGSESRVDKISNRKATKDTANALANLTIQPKTLRASISEVIAQAVEHKTASEDCVELLCSDPVVLNQAVNMTY